MCDRGNSGCFFFRKVIHAFSLSLIFRFLILRFVYLSFSHSVALIPSSDTHLTVLRAPFRTVRRSRETEKGLAIFAQERDRS